MGEFKSSPDARTHRRKCTVAGCDSHAAAGSQFCGKHMSPEEWMEWEYARSKKPLRMTRIVIKFVVRGDGKEEVRRFSDVFSARDRLQVFTEDAYV